MAIRILYQNEAEKSKSGDNDFFLLTNQICLYVGVALENEKLYHISNLLTTVKEMSTTAPFAVSGSFSVLKYILNLGTATRRGTNESNDPPPTHPGQYLINCFLCAWFITGMNIIVHFK